MTSAPPEPLPHADCPDSRFLPLTPLPLITGLPGLLCAGTILLQQRLSRSQLLLFALLGFLFSFTRLSRLLTCFPAANVRTGGC